MQFHSHIGQDQWVIETLNGKTGGYFLDFGSLDGVTANNTLTLEESFGWTGLCVEANPTYYPKVCQSRRATTINAALWSKSRDVIEMVDAWGLSSAVQHKDDDAVAEFRARDTRRIFEIETITANDLLARFDAPEDIDFMSLDIEGAELAVLSALDLNRYKIALMTIEHSHLPEKQRSIRSHLAAFGYQVFERGYDDWFYHPEHLAKAASGAPVDPEKAWQKVVAEYVVPDL